MKNKKGFTLIELLVAMAIIGLLIGMTIFGVSRAFQASRDTKRQNLVREIQTAIVSYEGKYSRLPTSISAVQNTSAGTSAITVGTGTNNVQLEYAMQVFIVANKAAGNTTGNELANVCYQNQANGYALGVKLESGGDTEGWYWMTTNKCT